MAAAFGVTLTVTRANSDGGYSGTITDAVVGAQRSAADAQGRLTVEYTTRVYLIPVDSYVLTGLGATEPKAGDRFGETIDGVRMTFDAVSADNEPAATHAGQRRAIWRVRTLRVTDEAGN